MSTSTLTPRIINTRTIQRLHPASHTYTGIVTLSWSTATRISPTFTIGPAIERRLFLRLEDADFGILGAVVTNGAVKTVYAGDEVAGAGACYSWLLRDAGVPNQAALCNGRN